jgi:glucan 1,3-beta-glucosidase
LAVWLAARYRDDDAFLGIGLMNEPTLTTDDTILHQYYTDAHAAIRATGNECLLTHMPLLWNQEPNVHPDFFPGYKNVWMEWHRYVIWGFEGQTED